MEVVNGSANFCSTPQELCHERVPLAMVDPFILQEGAPLISRVPGNSSARLMCGTGATSKTTIEPRGGGGGGAAGHHGLS